MALKRFISAMIGLVLFFAIIFLPPYVFGTVIFIIAVIAIHEYNNCLKKAGFNNYRAAVYLPAFVILFTVYKFEKGIDTLLSIKYVTAASLVFFIILITTYIFTHQKHNLKDVYSTVFGMAYLAPLFCTLVAVRYFSYGNYHIYLAFGGAWMTDTFAYYAGKLFGKKKLIPLISPNKTKAGAIGGLIGTTVCTVVYGYIMNENVYANEINMIVFVVLGVMLAGFSQIGDLIASAIKRQAKIKDFGNLMPGHGGALDRFDSVLFTSAITLAYVLMFF
jgi:phosphatidate cytidylyltransferase